VKRPTNFSTASSAKWQHSSQMLTYTWEETRTTVSSGKANPRIQSFMTAHNLKEASSLPAYFSQRVQKILERHGKKKGHMGGADAIAASVVVESGHSGSTLREAVQHGHEALLSPPYYLDQTEPSTDL